MQIEVDDSQMGCVSDYAKVSGRTEQSCIDEAVDDWIRVVAASFVTTERFNVIGFPERVMG